MNTALMSKASLRDAMLQKRKAMPFDIRAAADEAIAKRVLQSPEYASASKVFAYVSMPHEVHTRFLLGEILADGKQLALPVCDTNRHTMQFYLLRSMDELKGGAYRIPVPPVSSERCVQPDAVTLMLLPMLAFDAQGYRLGAGGGYYDRYLALYHPITMGLCYADCFVSALPRNEYDRRMLCCATEQRMEVF